MGTSTQAAPVAALPDITEIGLPRPGAPEDALANYSALQQGPFKSHPDEWGGAYIDGDVLVVNTVTRTPDEALVALASIGVTRGIRVEQVEQSIADLDAATAAVVSDGDLTTGINSVGPDFSQSRIVVGLDDKLGAADEASVTTKVTKVVSRHHGVRGPAAVAVFRSGRPHGTSRYYDTSPYYGGAAGQFSGTQNVTCSLGFGWLKSGVNYMVSASHCYSEDSDVRPRVKVFLSGGSVSTIGSVAWASGNNSGTISGRHGDVSVVQLSSGSASARVYTGTYDTSASRSVSGYVTLPQGWKGSNLFTSGAAGKAGTGTGELNPDWVSLTGQTVSYTNGQTYNGLSFMEHASQCVHNGDSGGAVYLQIGTTDSEAVGIISGTNNQGGGLTNCRSYYTPIGVVASDFGGALR